MPKLIKLTVGETSGVDRAANLREFLVQKGLNFLSKAKTILKSDEPKTFTETLKVSEAREKAAQLTSRLWKLWWALEESIDSIIRSDIDDKRGALESSVQEFVEVLESESLITKSQAVQTVEAFKNAPVWVSKDQHGMPGETYATPGQNDNQLENKRVELLQQIRSLCDALIEEAGGGQQPQQQPQEGNPMDGAAQTAQKAADSAASSIPEGLQKHFDDLRKQFDDQLSDLKKVHENEKTELNKRVEVAENLAKAEQNERLQKAAELFVKDELGNVPGDRNDLAGIIKTLRNEQPLNKEQLEKLETTLKAANEAINKGRLFEEAGNRGGNNAQNEGVVAKVQKAAAEIVKEKHVSEAAAMAEVFRNNPSWYNQYARSNSTRVGVNTED